MTEHKIAVREETALDRPAIHLSATIANILINQSPLHAWTAHRGLNPDYQEEEAKNLDFGTIAHALMLEGAHIAEVLDFPDYRKDKAKEARDLARAAGKVPILKKDYENVVLMVEAGKLQLSEYPDVFPTPGTPERRITWKEDGVDCKAILDYVSDSLKVITDYKTRNGSANPDVISRTIFSEGWDIKAAFYIRAVKSIDSNVDPAFYYVCQETYPPYALSVNSLAPDALMIGEKKVMYALEKWRECMESGVWPGYPTDVCFATLPPWEESKWLEKELR